jgi:phage FluMu protein Com
MIIGNAKIDIKCPRCKFFNSILIKQIWLKDSVICRGCKCTLRLDDYMGELKKAENTIGKLMNEINKIFGRKM